MTQLLLHVGTSKAGSTALQDFLALNTPRLRDHGLTCCPALRGPNHTELAVAFRRRPTRISRELGVGTERQRLRLLGRIDRRLRRAAGGDTTWIASTEHLSSLLVRREEIEDLAGLLGRHFDRVRILLVLRRGDHWLPSAYVESVRAGNTRPLDADYVHSRRRTLDHAALVRRWRRCFDEVHAVPFLESDKRDPLALPVRVLQAAGIPEDAHRPWRVPRLGNESVSESATEVLRLVNPALRTSPWRPTRSRRHAVAAVARAWPGPPTALTPEAATALDTAGWRDTGVASSPHAVGPGWDAWAAQPPAPIRPQRELGPQDVATAVRTLHDMGLLHPDDHLTGHQEPDASPVQQASDLVVGWARSLRQLT